MNGSGAVAIRRRFSPQFLASLFALSSLFTVYSAFLFNDIGLAQTAASAPSQHASAAQAFASPVLPTDTTLNDPLNSPYPLPWNAIWDQQTQATRLNRPAVLKYRTLPLGSPDGRLTAHSELQVQINPDFRQSHVFSELVLKTVQGQTLQVIPSTIHLGQSAVRETTARQMPGTIAMLIPAVWSSDSQKLLARQFEAIFGSDVSSDYAVVWDRRQQQAHTVAPQPLNYDSATLLGWSPTHPDQVLFRTTLLGEAHGSTLAVDYRGNVVGAANPQPIWYGRRP